MALLLLQRRLLPTVHFRAKRYRISADVAVIPVPPGTVKLFPAFRDLTVDIADFFVVFVQDVVTASVFCLARGRMPQLSGPFVFLLVILGMEGGARGAVGFVQPERRTGSDFPDVFHAQFRHVSFHCPFHVLFLDTELFGHIFATKAVTAFLEVFAIDANLLELFCRQPANGVSTSNVFGIHVKWRLVSAVLPERIRSQGSVVAKKVWRIKFFL